MRYTIKNNSAALQGVPGAGGLVYIRPGHERPVDLSEEAEARVKRLPFLHLTASDEAVAGAGGQEMGDSLNASEIGAQAAALLAAADGMNFMKFKSAAAKVLMDATPATKDDILAALQHVVETAKGGQA